ncbi:hypothetical protein DFH08DRAFT_875667 [Mycena albidolilacea]|uniref:DUF6699 domain-containing protein n=1 Tax=Mycena albidolilacea TaxID=1033008 RepID=A0AAD6ZU88_9AGAR|nr:hypothetical protein DFH08DRAFT_875667 [Mycena albidolilacea]
MPGRHVRFSAENSFYSPAPLLSRSVSSATSSSGPFTPPSLPYAGLPGPTPYKPRRSYTTAPAATARAHTLVAFADSPLLNFDLTVHPSAITTHFQGVASAGFLEPAVYPPQRTISITTPHLPWTITATASNGRFVTVADALNALYRSLRTNITATEFNALGTQKLARRVTEAYTRRYMRFLGHRGYAEEKKEGVKRVDFLMGCTKFQGLSPTGAAGVWRLHIS